MGSGASQEYSSVEEALAAGVPQSDIDAFLAEKAASAAAATQPDGGGEGGGGSQSAFLFIKPHAAASDKVESLVKEMLAAAGVAVAQSGILEAKEIDERKLIDVHYGAIANRAVLQEPHELNVPQAAQDKFEAAFGLAWDQALRDGLVCNAHGAAKRLGGDGPAVGPAALEAAWRAIPKAELVKFGGGFYCGKLMTPNDAGGAAFYAINCFYLNMRADFTTPPAQIKWFAVDFPASLPWADFRAKVLGATDPTAAAAGSIRRAILDQWEALGLAKQPFTGENGVHASASPLEGLFERMNWLGADPAADPYGASLVAAGIPATTLSAWSKDPAVAFDGGAFSVFDLHEDLTLGDCTAKALQVYAANKEAAYL